MNIVRYEYRCPNLPKSFFEFAEVKNQIFVSSILIRRIEKVFEFTRKLCEVTKNKFNIQDKIVK